MSWLLMLTRHPSAAMVLKQFFHMMMSSNGNIFFVTGPLCREYTGHWWIPRSKANDMFSLICAWIKGWVNNREAGDLRRHCAHYDVIVMRISLTQCQKCWHFRIKVVITTGLITNSVYPFINNVWHTSIYEYNKHDPNWFWWFTVCKNHMRTLNLVVLKLKYSEIAR